MRRLGGVVPSGERKLPTELIKFGSYLSPRSRLGSARRPLARTSICCRPMPVIEQVPIPAQDALRLQAPRIMQRFDQTADIAGPLPRSHGCSENEFACKGRHAQIRHEMPLGFKFGTGMT